MSWRLVVLILVASVKAHAAPVLSAGFEDREIITGLDLPVALEFAATGELFVAEKSGLVKRFAPPLSSSTGTVVVDIRDQVASAVDRGLLGLALDPGYPAQPYLYALFAYDAPPGELAPYWNDTCGGAGQPDEIDPGGGCVVMGRLVRYTLSNGVATAATVLLQDAWYQQYSSHSVGDLAFGRDGNLYVSAGDGASYMFADSGGASQVSTLFPNLGDAIDAGGSLRAQDLLTPGDAVGLSGTILRLDPATGARAAGNPLSGDAGRIIAFGLRNPFRIAFRPGTDELWIADVGLETAEEIDRIADVTDDVVENFGWPCYEGPGAAGVLASAPICQALITDTLTPAPPGLKTPPHFSYAHARAPGWNLPNAPCISGTSAAVVGLTFYEGVDYPAQFAGSLFFADYSSRCIYAMRADAGGVPDPSRIEIVERDAPAPVAFATGPDGDVYYATIWGDIRRLRFAGSGPRAFVTASATSGSSPLLVQFDGSGSSDPDGGQLAYAWDLDGDGGFDDSTEVTPSSTFSPGSYVVRVRVTDAENLTDISDSITITVDNRPPLATILEPSSVLEWGVDQVIQFSGAASDPDEGSLGAASMRWTITLLHCPGGGCHPHPVASFYGVDHGQFVTAPDGYPAYYAITLTVVDAAGLVATETTTIEGQGTALHLSTSPGGVPVLVDNLAVMTPVTQTEVVGARLSIAATLDVEIDGVAYAFKRWSDGGARAHDIVVPPTAMSYVAIYEPVVAAEEPDRALDRGGCSTNRGAGWWVIVACWLAARISANARRRAP